MKLLSMLMIALLTLKTVVASAHSTVFVYMDSSARLSDMAIKNITDMAWGMALNDSVTVRVQLHAYDNVAIRYVIEHYTIIYQETVMLTGNPVDDIVAGAAWAFVPHRASKNMLVLWNHGYGILDPIWDPVAHEWIAEPDAMESFACTRHLCIQKDIALKKHHRGFVFSATQEDYLRSSYIPDLLNRICHDVLGGQKLDLLGCDMCMGAMMEIAYLAAPYARYLVGSQNCEMRDGWNFAGWLEQLCADDMSAQQAAAAVVNTFKTYYEEHTQEEIYTCAAIDLSGIDQLKQLIDRTAVAVIECVKQYGDDFRQSIIRARRASPRFCFVPTYTDLQLFCQIFEQEIASYESCDLLSQLQNALRDISAMVEKLTIAHCQGVAMQGLANGLSIYFPLSHIDSSYFGNSFARESAWIDFLQLIASA